MTSQMFLTTNIRRDIPISSSTICRVTTVVMSVERRKTWEKMLGGGTSVRHVFKHSYPTNVISDRHLCYVDSNPIQALDMFEEVKVDHENCVDALDNYLLEAGCCVPGLIWSEIMRVQRNRKKITVKGSIAVVGNAGALTLSRTKRVDPRLANAVDEELTPSDSDYHKYYGMNKHLLQSLRKPPADYNWNKSYNEEDAQLLKTYIDQL